MKLAIVGSRTFSRYGWFKFVVVHYYPICNIEQIVSGGAKGADSLAKRYAKEYDIPYLEFPANWELYGKSAGYRRNIDIVNACDEVLAFWDGVSRGTKHTIDTAKKQGKKVTVINIG